MLAVQLPLAYQVSIRSLNQETHSTACYGFFQFQHRTIMSELNRRLIIVSNRLPFQVKIKNKKIELKESDGGLVSSLKSYFESSTKQYQFTDTFWVGTADFSEKHWSSVKRKLSTESGYKAEPVFPDKKMYDRYYNGFCNATLWPLFHYFPSYVEFDVTTFNAYEEMNRTFADKLLSLLRPDDVLWVHDYQLMLLPAMIREKRPEATIGYFHHIPFPSFEIFRMLHRPWKEQLVNGLLGADLVGFHTHEYVQHFLKTVQMTTGHDHRFRTVYTSNRSVKAEMFPLGIDFDKFHTAIDSEPVANLNLEIANGFAGKKIIFSVDRLDYTKGITHRLLGYERFLELYPEWKEKVVFILVVVPSRQIISKYTERKRMIEEEIGRINGKLSTLTWQPIIYRYNHLEFHELVSLYNTADVGLITPLRDGMNLVAKEFIASKKNTGVLILSELAGAANELGEAIQVNPMDREEVAHAINTGLLMDQKTCAQKIQVQQERLRDYTVIHWMNDFLGQLNEMKEVQHRQKTRHLSSVALMTMLTRYREAERRALLLDYDGTLVPYSKHPSLAVPDKNLIELLRVLALDHRNEVTIISGRSSASLNDWFSELPITLISEHGAAIRFKDGEWNYNIESEQSWKKLVRPTLDLFCQRSPGSFVEEKNHTLVWHYRNVETDLGFIRSRELLDSLHHLLRNSNLNIIDGNKVLEIRNAGIDKGKITKTFLEQNQFQFVMAIGDDKTDEDMFNALSEEHFSIKIGVGHTNAQFNLTDQKEAIVLLAQLAKASKPISEVV